MERYPLLFTFKNVVVGCGFVAGVVSEGRALLIEEEHGLWMLYGVNPGGLAAEGDSRNDTMGKFRAMYQAVLNELARDAHSFDEYRECLTTFFHQESDAEEWAEAVAEIRASGKYEGFEKIRSADDARFEIAIVELTSENAQPSMNDDPLEKVLAVAA